MYISLLLIKRLRISHDFKVNFGHFKKIYPFSEKTSPFFKKITYLKKQHLSRIKQKVSQK